MKKTLSILFLFVAMPLLAAYKYNLSVCTVFQNEAEYLQEWIEFHHLLGVDHFYLYNNLSEDHYQKILDPFIEKGLVELTDWPFAARDVRNWDEIQIGAYNDGLNKAKSETKWLALLDTDEFLFPTQEDNLKKFLKPYAEVKGIGGILVNWVVYGTSRVAKIPANQLLIETLVLSSSGGSDHFKSIFMPKRVDHVCSPHYVIYKKGYNHVMPSQKPHAPGAIEIDRIRINHYWSRDEWFLNNIKIPRRTLWGTDPDTCRLWAEAGNGAYDTSIFRFIDELRARLGK